VAHAASQSSGGVPEDLLGDYLPMLAEAATWGRRPGRAQLEAVRRQGRRAATVGVSAGRGVDLYLSAARGVWGELPAVVRERDSKAVRAAAEAVLQVVDDAVASFAEGHAEAVRELVRREETLRRELVEDLLRGDARVGELVERAEPFGLDLTRDHQVALAEPAHRDDPTVGLADVDAATSALERMVIDSFGDRDVLVATKEGMLVVLALFRGTARDLGALVHAELSRLRGGRAWTVAVGRGYPGAYGIARSYEEAREGLTMAKRMQMTTPVVHISDLLIYRVLARDQPALIDLVQSVLSPLIEQRGGARPMVDTLAAYFDSGCVATAAAHRLHLSVRAVTYRLDRVRAVTGLDPRDPAHRFTLQAAVVGAKLLGWPERATDSTVRQGR
jgi:sugar diacid utilization regulator